MGLDEPVEVIPGEGWGLGGRARQCRGARQGCWLCIGSGYVAVSNQGKWIELDTDDPWAFKIYFHICICV